MNEEIRLLMSNVNTSIIQIRAAYAMWAKVHGLNYHEVLIFYAMRDNEECTQKKIADSYRLPKQTVNNIITSLKKDGYLTLIPGRKNAKEKIYRSIMEPILEFETLASEKMGKEEIRQMTALAMKFGQILEESISLQTNTDVTKEGNHNE